MSVRPIILWPEPWLNQLSALVLPEEYNSEVLLELATDLVDTMRAARGVGLAAPQLGVHKRIVVVPNPEKLAEGGVLVLCNPVLTDFSEEKHRGLEGCLSLPGLTLSIERSNKVRVSAKRVDGTDFLGVWEGFSAVALQHECNHLDGITIADSVGPLGKSVLRKKLKKVMKVMERAQESKREVAKLARGSKPDPSEYALPSRRAP
jgi:peptide deformylase